MKSTTWFVSLLLAAALAGGGSLLAKRFESNGQDLVELPQQAAEVDQLLYARPFLLHEGYTHWFRAEQPLVRSGWILVLAVDPLTAEPRESLHKVLYAGAQTAERINHGSQSGRIVVLVPAEHDARNLVNADWQSQPIFFGGLELPERVDAAVVQAELAAARSRGLGARPATELEAALHLGGSLLELPDRLALEHELADLIQSYSTDPVDLDIARGLRIAR